MQQDHGTPIKMVGIFVTVTSRGGGGGGGGVGHARFC